MNIEQAIKKDLYQVWVSSGSKKQDKLAFVIRDDLRSKGVTAEVIPLELSWTKANAVWRDREFEKRLKEDEDE
jgi:hypothetical protein